MKLDFLEKYNSNDANSGLYLKITEEFGLPERIYGNRLTKLVEYNRMAERIKDDSAHLNKMIESAKKRIQEAEEELVSAIGYEKEKLEHEILEDQDKIDILSSYLSKHSS